MPAAAAAATTAATAAPTAGRHASSAATASYLSSCRLLFPPLPPPSRLLVSSVVAPDPDDYKDDDDNVVSAASTATTTAARVCRLQDWASHCPSIISPSSLSSLMSSLLSQPHLQMPPHWCRRDCLCPPTERPHSRRASLAGAVVIVLVVVALRH